MNGPAQRALADHGAAEQHEGHVQSVVALVAGAQAAQVVQPGERALHDPPLAPEMRAVIDAAGQHVPPRQLPCPGRVQGLVDPHTSGEVIHGPPGPNRPPVLQGERVLESPQGLPGRRGSQRQPPRVALRGGTRTDSGPRAGEDRAVGARRRAPQRPRRGCATTGEVRGIDIPSGYDNKRGTDS